MLVRDQYGNFHMLAYIDIKANYDTQKSIITETTTHYN